MASKTVHTTCLGCISSCGAIYQVENNRIVKVEGDPNHPLTRGFMCPKGLVVEDVRSHRERLRYPLKRIGKRGEGKWKQISWDEAIDETAAKLGEVRDKYGAEAVVGNVGAIGVLAGIDPDIGRFLAEFGTPNRLVSLYICNLPAHLGGIYTCGFSLVFGADYSNSKCIVLWGFGAESAMTGAACVDILEARRKGAKLIVIDPRPTPLARESDIWLRVRPGTDCALALGMLNVVINEGLYDSEFVEKWTFGFDRLQQHVQQYTPEKVAEITWIPAEKIKDAARMYAQNRPAAIGQGGGGLCHGINAFQHNRAISLLPALTGNIDVPGGHIGFAPLLKDRAVMACQYHRVFGKLSEEQIEKTLGYDFNILKHDRYMMAHPAGVWPAITEGKPYPVKAMLALGSNLLSSTEDTLKVREVLMDLDFFAISDLFMTPTCELADIVFPVVHFTERDEIVDAYTRNYIFCHHKIVDPPEECREDKEILIELAKKLGMEGYFKSVEESLNYRLQRVRMTLEEFKEKGKVEAPIEYRKHEKFGGFRTGTGKIELYSETLEKIGSDPMPIHKEPPESPVSTPELARDFPLVLAAGYKVLPYFQATLRNVAALRELVPEPYIDIHPDTAKELGIEDQDWVQIETRRGSIKHKARYNDGLDPRVVVTPHGWWYGYKDGWKEVNVNILTESDHYDPDVGSAPLRGLLCRVKKAAPPEQLS